MPVANFNTLTVVQTLIKGSLSIAIDKIFQVLPAEIKEAFARELNGKLQWLTSCNVLLFPLTALGLVTVHVHC